MSSAVDVLTHLEQVVHARKQASPENSYVASLYAKGRKTIAQKVGEEGVETALAALLGDRKEVINESADLLFHLLVLLADADVALAEVLEEMRRREGTSGLAERYRP